MKIPLHLLLSTALPLGVFGWTSSSAFTGRPVVVQQQPTLNKHHFVMYNDAPRDPPDSSDQQNMFTVLANTERWLSDTLAASQTDGPSSSNPFTRKEVSYVCENSPEAAMIVAGTFRRLKEAREQGETHGQMEEERLMEKGQVFSPRTLRQTQVIVVPSNQVFTNSFATFDTLIESINQARRNARDYVTDVSLEKLDENYGDGERDWSVSVNCAHLHPKFGEPTPEEELEEMKNEDLDGEVDLNLKAYKEKRLLARRSPYPTIVIEVRSTPPPDFGAPNTQPHQEEEKITSEDIQRLEALFGKSAAMDHPAKTNSLQDENDFYDAIGKASGIDEISLVTPMILAQNWVATHDDRFDPNTSTFTATETKHVDEGYEFVFTNLAMQTSIFAERNRVERNMRQYLVMNNFLSASATSFEKFATEVSNIVQSFPGISGQAKVTTLHPEHVDPTKRAPVPVFVWTWNDHDDE
jgi:hypothetical protein